jgi:hypothetical protein
MQALRRDIRRSKRSANNVPVIHNHAHEGLRYDDQGRYGRYSEECTIWNLFQRDAAQRRQKYALRKRLLSYESA